MQRRAVSTAFGLDFGEMPFDVAQGGPVSGAHGRWSRNGLWLAASGVGPEKYRILDLKRRRAQIRARRELGLS